MLMKCYVNDNHLMKMNLFEYITIMLVIRRTATGKKYKASNVTGKVRTRKTKQLTKLYETNKNK